MPKNPGQKRKLLYLMKILLEETDEEHGLTMKELLEGLLRYGIVTERKSVYDDIEVLREYGLDVENTPERRRRYYVGARAFQLPELRLLVDAVQSSRFITHKKSSELIKKVESLCSVHEAKLLQRQVYVANRIKTMNESIYYNIDKIQTAIGQGRQVSFRYFHWKVSFEGMEKYKKEYRHAGGRYTISPWALSWDDENYYMIGFDASAGKIKHYRVDKMESISMTELPREGEGHFEAFDMAVYSKGVFGMYGGQEETVGLLFENAMIGVVLDRFGKDVFLRREDDGHFKIQVKVQVSPQFFSWVFGLGTQVKLLTPPAVVQAFEEHLRKTLGQYQK